MLRRLSCLTAIVKLILRGPTKVLICSVVFDTLKAKIHFLTQSCDPISCNGKPVERNNEYRPWTDFFGPLQCFPVTTHRIAQPSQRVNWDLYDHIRPVSCDVSTRLSASSETMVCLIWNFCLLPEPRVCPIWIFGLSNATLLQFVRTGHVWHFFGLFLLIMSDTSSVCSYWLCLILLRFVHTDHVRHLLGLFALIISDTSWVCSYWSCPTLLGFVRTDHVQHFLGLFVLIMSDTSSVCFVSFGLSRASYELVKLTVSTKHEA